jgi:hypothetical protein
VHRTTLAAVLGAVAIAAAFGLSGCGEKPDHPAASVQTPTSNAAPSPNAAPPAEPLPPPAALADVMYKLADPNIAGADKVGLVEFATPDDAATLDRFGRALRDSGAPPLTIEAHDLKWAQGEAGNVMASIVIKTANRQAGDFRFPMEFSPIDGSWQLTRQTADLLLQLGQDPPPTPTP